MNEHDIKERYVENIEQFLFGKKNTKEEANAY